MIRYANYMEAEQVAERTERNALGAGRVAAWIARQVEMSLAESDLSLSQYRVLGLLGEGMSLPSSMADRLDVRRPSITAVVDGLVNRGFVVRSHAEDDRRQVTHGITAQGRAVLKAADDAVDARLASIAGHLDDEAESAQAMHDLALWGKALINVRHAKLAAR
jgi:long-chain acyl-CoA synthetase